MKRTVFIWLALFHIVSIVLPRESAASAEAGAAGLIKETIAPLKAPSEVVVGGESVRVTVMLKRFYKNRGYAPAWSEDGGPSANVEDFLWALSTAYEEGLRPEDYPIEHMEALANRLRADIADGRPSDPAETAEMDLLLTSAFIGYGYHLLAGRVQPGTSDGEWSDYAWEADLDKFLAEAIASGDVSGALKRLAPPHSDYYALRDALAQYTDIALNGGWPQVPAGPYMSKGHRSPRVATLRQRLETTGDLREETPENEKLFDEAVEAAVAGFQERHGLKPDGVVGPATIEALNVPVEDRIRQLELNMERWRWLPTDLGSRYILVNTAAFELKVVEHRREAMKMRIVAGKPYWHTPSFSARMTYLVLNPPWNAPRSIAAEEILPKARKDPRYLKREGFVVLKGWGERTEEVDPGTVDWSTVTEEGLAFRFVQRMGPLNPLGRIKFMFPNRYNVYLHDTPSKGLFEKTVRTFSHGCIRIEKPLELASRLMGVPEKDIAALIEEGKELEVPLPEPIMVHTLYWTAWVEEDGTVNFRQDIYGRDQALLELLSMPPVTP